jgi:hypothetical protein
MSAATIPPLLHESNPAMVGEHFKAKMAVRPSIRYTPPRCDHLEPYPDQDWEPKSHCGHAARYHEPESPDIDENLRYFGLRRNRRTGASEFPPAPKSRGDAPIPKRTLENIAACAAVGLSYWSEAPGVNRLWAVDDKTRKAHEVRIDRKAGKALGNDGWKTWEVAPTMNALALQLEPNWQANMVARAARAQREAATIATAEGSVIAQQRHIDAAPKEDVSAKLGPTGYCSSGRHNRCAYRDGGQLHGGITTSEGNHYSCPCECHSVHQIETRGKAAQSTREATRAPKAKASRKPARSRTEAQELTAKTLVKVGKSQHEYAEAGLHNEKPMSREVARGLLEHDPDYLDDITTAALVDLLCEPEVAEHHETIRAELKRRGLTPVNPDLTARERLDQSGVA